MALVITKTVVDPRVVKRSSSRTDPTPSVLPTSQPVLVRRETPVKVREKAAINIIGSADNEILRRTRKPPPPVKIKPPGAKVVVVTDERKRDPMLIRPRVPLIVVRPPPTPIAPTAKELAEKEARAKASAELDAQGKATKEERTACESGYIRDSGGKCILAETDQGVVEVTDEKGKSASILKNIPPVVLIGGAGLVAYLLFFR